MLASAWVVLDMAWLAGLVTLAYCLVGGMDLAWLGWSVLAGLWVGLILLTVVRVVLDLAWPAGLVTLAYYLMGVVVGIMCLA